MRVEKEKKTGRFLKRLATFAMALLLAMSAMPTYAYADDGRGKVDLSSPSEAHGRRDRQEKENGAATEKAEPAAEESVTEAPEAFEEPTPQVTEGSLPDGEPSAEPAPMEIPAVPPVGIMPLGLYPPAPMEITAEVTLYPPGYGWSAVGSQYGYFGIEWEHILQNGFDSGYNYVRIVSGYDGDDWLYGIGGENGTYPLTAENAVFVNNSTVHCIEYGLTAPSPGGDNTRYITMKYVGETTYDGRVFFLYWGVSRFHFDLAYAYSDIGQSMGLFIAIPKELGDPVAVAAYKKDSRTGEGYGKDDPDGTKLAGAQFTMRFWEGLYFSTVEEAEAYGSPSRTWIVETGITGAAMLGNALPGSDPFYYAYGERILPLGTVVIQETKAPDGYLLPSPNIPSIQQITYDSTLDAVIEYNPPVIMEQPREVEVRKADAASGAALPGAEFTLMRESFKGAGDWQQLYASKETGPDGSVGWSPVPVGSYKLVETRAPAGYMLPSAAGFPDEHPFEVREDSTEPVEVVTFTDFGLGGIEIIKEDAANGAPVPDTAFTLWAYEGMAVRAGLVAGDVASIAPDDPAWREVGTAVTGQDGKASFDRLPFGYYMLRETRPNQLYAGYEEAGGQPRMFAIDASGPPEAQVFGDDLIHIGVQVYEKTIYLTSSALDSGDLGTARNVGKEEYTYSFGARSTSNVALDEFVVEADLSGITALGYRMTVLWTGTSPAGLDFDGRVTVLYRTNLMTGGEAPAFYIDPLAGNPPNPNNGEGAAPYTYAPGWRVWAEAVSATESATLFVSSLNLAPGEYVTGIRAVYGGVGVGFFTGSGWAARPEPNSLRSGDQGNLPLGFAGLWDWEFSMIATYPLRPYMDGVETVMVGSVRAFGSRNAGVLTDEDYDRVETRVIEPFALYFPYVPRTGEGISPYAASITLLAAGSVLSAASALRRRRGKAMAVR